MDNGDGDRESWLGLSSVQRRGTQRGRASSKMVGELALWQSREAACRELICLTLAQFAQPSGFAHDNCGHFYCRANTVLPSPLQKYSAFVLTQIIGITPPVSRRMRGRIVTNVTNVR